MYIADTGNSRLLVCDLDGNVQLELTRPDSTLYENETFKPQKVVVDKAGNIYMVLNNITNGSAMFNSDGEFQAISVPTPWTLLRKWWRTTSGT